MAPEYLTAGTPKELLNDKVEKLLVKVMCKFAFENHKAEDLARSARTDLERLYDEYLSEQLGIPLT